MDRYKLWENNYTSLSGKLDTESSCRKGREVPHKMPETDNCSYFRVAGSVICENCGEEFV